MIFSLRLLYCVMQSITLTVETAVLYSSSVSGLALSCVFLELFD